MARYLTAFAAVLLVVGCDDGSEPDGAESTSGGSTGGVQESSGMSDPSTSGSPSGGTTTGAPDTTEGSSSSFDPTGGETGSSGGELEGVPVVVSLAHGGQTARSCDGGQTWTGFNSFGIQDDHSDYAAFGGLTFGNGAFIAATGWGAPAHILRSTDGVIWEDLGDEAFVTDEGIERPNSSSGVEFVGDGFVLFAGAHMWRSEDGAVWTANTPESLGFIGHFREVEYLPEPGLLLLATEDWEAPGTWTIQVSDDGGATWQQGTGATSACVGYVQHVGGFAHHDGRLLLAGGTGPTCVSDDGGLTWTEAADVGAEIADVKSYEGGFVVLTQGGDVFSSVDGSQWSSLGASALDGGRIGWHDDLGFFGEGNGVYVHSDDGVTWSPSSTTAPRGFVAVREFAVGRLPACE